MNKHQYLPIDFHCHSTYSDGYYNVATVLQKVKDNGGKYIALTDHDTTKGITEARQVAKKLDLEFVAGVEISVTWNNSLVHILGLGVDENNAELNQVLQEMRSNRILRGQKISANLEKIGIYGALEGALSYCANPENLSRTHFSHWLVAKEHAKPGKAFEKYLAPGKAGYVSQEWLSLEKAVKLITNAGGVAAIAHPSRYKFTRTKLIKLIDEFMSYGGIGIEVISSSHTPKDIEDIAALCRIKNMYATMGSDFHTEESYRTIKVGVNRELPAGLMPIYEKLKLEIDISKLAAEFNQAQSIKEYI